LFENRREEDVDARDKRGHDAETLIQYDRNMV
jgi:phage-related protein